MGEGARRAGEGSSGPLLFVEAKSPHPAFGHLLPRVPRGRRGIIEVEEYSVKGRMSAAKRSVKLSCRNLWKVFGPGAEDFMRRQKGETSAEALAQAKLI